MTHESILVPWSRSFVFLWRLLYIGIGEGNGNPLQYSYLENPMDRGAWRAAVYGVTKSRTWLSDSTFTFHFHALEKEMATHSSVLAWRIPGTADPGGLPSMGSHRVRHDWSDLAATLHRHSWWTHWPLLIDSTCSSLPLSGNQGMELKVSTLYSWLVTLATSPHP